MQIETAVPTAAIASDTIGSPKAPDAADAEIRAGVSREFHNFLADLEELVSKTTTLTGEDLTQASAELGERVAAARQSVEALAGVIDQHARKSASATNDYVHAQPWNAVGIGAGVGFLLGFLLARRN